MAQLICLITADNKDSDQLRLDVQVDQLSFYMLQAFFSYVKLYVIIILRASSQDSGSHACL